MDVAIPNLDFIRQLIADARQDVPSMDAETLRMLQGTGMGMDALTQENE
jgi:hypothetical protein